MNLFIKGFSVIKQLSKWLKAIQAPFFGSTYAIPVRHNGVAPILGDFEAYSPQNWGGWITFAS